MILLNTIAGDIIGSKYEFSNIHSKEFELFQDDMHYTDDTVLTIATIDALLEINKRYTEESYEFEKDIDEKLISIFKEKYYEYKTKKKKQPTNIQNNNTKLNIKQKTE